MIQFIKGPWRSGEDEFAKRFRILLRKAKDPEQRRRANSFLIKKMGLGFIGILGDKLRFSQHKKAAHKALAYFKKEMATNRWDLIILDEINVAISLKLLKVKEVLAAIKKFPKNKLLILTGRGAPKELIKIADLATEMRELKHPFKKGILGRLAVEF